MGKLVRDKIPDMIRADGRLPDIRVLDLDEYVHALKSKLLEEAEEVAHAPRAHVAEELADVLEVVRAIARVNNISMEQLDDIARAKLDSHGGFTDRLYLNSW